MNNLNNKNISSERYIFWLNDISVFFKNYGYVNFVPRSDMTRIEQLNALTLFCLYLIILLLIFDQTGLIFIPLCGIILFIVLYNVFETQNNEFGHINKREHFKQYNIELGKNNKKNHPRNNKDLFHTNAKKHRDTKEKVQFDTNSKEHRDNYGKYNDDEDLKLKIKNISRKQTLDKRFMNQLINPLNKDQDHVPVACNANDKDIDNELKSSYNVNICKDIDNVFDDKNSQRQIYNTSHNVPKDQDQDQDQEAFAKWCYKFPDTGKTDQLKY